MIEVYYKLGINASMLMAYNLKNLVGDGCLEPGNGGLSRFGASLVKEMSRACRHDPSIAPILAQPHVDSDVFEVSTDPVIIWRHSPVTAPCDRSPA